MVANNGSPWFCTCWLRTVRPGARRSPVPIAVNVSQNSIAYSTNANWITHCGDAPLVISSAGQPASKSKLSLITVPLRWSSLYRCNPQLHPVHECLIIATCLVTRCMQRRKRSIRYRHGNIDKLVMIIVTVYISLLLSLFPHFLIMLNCELSFITI